MQEVYFFPVQLHVGAAGPPWMVMSAQLQETAILELESTQPAQQHRAAKKGRLSPWRKSCVWYTTVVARGRKIRIRAWLLLSPGTALPGQKRAQLQKEGFSMD